MCKHQVLVNFHSLFCTEIEWLEHFTKLDVCILNSKCHTFPKWATSIWEMVENLKNELIRPYSKSSLTLTEWRFDLSFSWVLMLFLNSWKASVIPYSVTTHPAAIQKQHWHSRRAQIEPPLIECECEWAFRIRALILNVHGKMPFEPTGHLNEIR
jgi:hypothetical protein